MRVIDLFANSTSVVHLPDGTTTDAVASRDGGTSWPVNFERTA